MVNGPFNPLAVPPFMGLLLGLWWPVWASGPKVDLTVGVQSEGGGDALRGDRATARRTVFQVEPDLVWRRRSPGLALAASLGPAVAFPSPRRGSALSTLRGMGEARFFPSRRTLLEAVLRTGYTALDEGSPWAERWRLSGDLSGGLSLSGSLFLNAGYAYARSTYSGSASTFLLPSPSAKALGPADHGRAWGRQRKELKKEKGENAGSDEQEEQADPVSAPGYLAEETGPGDPVATPVAPSEVFSPQGDAAALSKRRERRHRLQAGLTWTGARTWLSGNAELIQNRSSISGYDYRGFQIGGESGMQLGPIELALQSSDEQRRYEGEGESWRFIWFSARASCRLTPWLYAFAELQREYGLQGHRRAYAPWSFAGAGLRATLPRSGRAPEPAADAMRPHATGKGWRFQLQAPEARSVHLIGTFCGWDRQAHPLSPGEKKGTWEVVIPLGPGTYEYAFLVDGQEVVTPPQAPMYVDDGFGQRNGVLVVEDK